jgi:hypothetical protein
VETITNKIPCWLVLMMAGSTTFDLAILSSQKKNVWVQIQTHLILMDCCHAFDLKRWVPIIVIESKLCDNWCYFSCNSFWPLCCSSSENFNFLLRSKINWSSLLCAEKPVYDCYILVSYCLYVIFLTGSLGKGFYTEI